MRTSISDRLRIAVENNELQNNVGGGLNAEVRRGIAVEAIVASALEGAGFEFLRAHTQQAYDFQQITHNEYFPGQIVNYLEVKKFTGSSVICNDTMPDGDVHYLLVRLPRRGAATYCFKLGHELNGLSTPELRQEQAQFREQLDQLRRRFAHIGPILRTYVRPTYRIEIRPFLDEFQPL